MYLPDSVKTVNAKKVTVENESDHLKEEFHHKINKTALTYEELEKLHLSQSEQTEEEPSFMPAVRDYSINNYNGNPGLSQWGYENPYVSRNKFQLKKYRPS